MDIPANDDAPAQRILSVSEPDLRAYVEGRLDDARRAAIEGFLAGNPDLAAQVMTALHMRGRVAGSAPGRGRRAGRARLAGLAVAGLACMGAGWSAAAAFASEGPRAGDPPNYVAEAVMSSKATQVRTVMISQPETPRLDAAEIRRTMNLRLPALPRGWRIVDVQVYPSDDGPGVSLLVETDRRRRLNLFVVRADAAATSTPVVTRKDGAFVAYWEVGQAAYALTGEGSGDEILGQAARLSRSGLL